MGTQVTGERISTPDGGFNPAWQRHSFAYAACDPILGPGRVLDLGCGVGHSFDLLAPRETVGLDIDPEALSGQDRETVIGDIRAVPFPDSNFESVISMHSIEHVPDPERVVAEISRLVEPGGTAVVVTPNRLTFGRPDEIIDPFHFIEFSPEEFGRLCGAGFEEVELQGLFASDRYMELFDEERRTLDKLLRLDPLKLRRLVPLRAKQWLYDFLLRHFRRDDDPRAEMIDQTDFELRTSDLDRSLDLYAICRKPKRA
ncbi:MAG TPA: class I SAM-dependent methyltransferase [Solirubrobacterales bacterium]|nr:class I SAM-dependent methyltransferase [Solirubrobacterales bacterium]